MLNIYLFYFNDFMKLKINYLFLAAIVISIHGCSIIGSNSDDNVAVDSVEPETVFEEETELEETENGAEIVTNSGLIPSTNPEKRVEIIQKGRTDPFALIAAQPSIEIAPPPANSTETSSNNSSSSSSTTSKTKNTTTQKSQVSPKTQPKVTVSPSEVKKKPEPEIIARQVEVMGVIDVNGVAKAIIKAPLEPSSRYVEANQSLSGGRIIVKRINSGSLDLEPQVILEDIATGIEIVKRVGELPPALETEDTVALVH